MYDILKDKEHLSKRVETIIAAENTMYEKGEVFDQMKITATHLHQIIDLVLCNNMDERPKELLNLSRKIEEMTRFLKEVHEFRNALMWYTKAIKLDKDLPNYLAKWLNEQSI